MCNILPNFSVGLKRARKDRGKATGKLYTQDAFAAEFRRRDGTPVSKQSVCNWEQGKAMPDANTLEDICNFFGCSMDYLFNRTSCRSADAQLINEKIGLSEKAIDRLSVVKLLEDTETLATLSVLLTNSSFWTALEEFHLARRLESGCKQRDQAKKALDLILAGSGVDYYERHEEDQDFHFLVNDRILEGVKSELSPDERARLGYMLAEKYLKDALNDIRNGGTGK